MIEIGLSELAARVEAMNGFKDGGWVRRSFKFFQRLSFPLKINTGRGRKAILNLEQAIQVLFALELVRVGLSPVRAVRIARTNWDKLLFAFAVGWLVYRRPDLSKFRYFLVMDAGVLENRRRTEDPCRPIEEPFRLARAAEILEWSFWQASSSKIMIDGASLVSCLIRAFLFHSELYTDDMVDGSFRNLWYKSSDTTPSQWIQKVDLEGGRCGKRVS